MMTSALWDDEHGVVHQLRRGPISRQGVWRVTCGDVIADGLHVNSSRCVAVTCLWCAQDARGPWFQIQ